LSDDGRRLFSDEELGLIVQNAAELQEEASGVDATFLQRSTDAPDSEGLTIEEVRDIASEVGLESRFVDEAVLALSDDQALKVRSLFGGAVAQWAEGTLPDALTDADRVDMLELVRSTLGQRGEVDEVLGVLEWQSVGRMTRTTITIRTHGESSALRVQTDASGVAALTWLGSIGVGLVAGAGLVGALHPDSVLAAVSIVGAGGVAGVGIGRTIWSTTTQALRRRVRRVRDVLLHMSAE